MVIIRRYIYINGEERIIIDSVELLKTLFYSGKITNDTLLFDEQSQSWVSMVQIPEFGQFVSNAYNSYQPFYNNAEQENYYNAGKRMNADIYSTMRPKKRSKTVILVTAIIALVVGISVFLMITLNNGSGASAAQENSAVQKIIEMRQELDNGNSLAEETFSESEYGTYAQVLDVTQDYFMKLKEAKDKVQEEIGKLDIESIFTVDTLGNLDNIRSTKERIENYVAEYQAYEETMRQAASDYKKNVSSLDLPDGFKQGFFNGFNKTNDEAMSMLEEFFSSEEKCISSIYDILNLLENKQGEYTFDNGQIVFYSDEDVDTYNQLYNTMQQAGNKETELQNEMVQKSKENLGQLQQSFTDQQ